MADPSKLLPSLGVCRCSLCNCDLDEGVGIMLRSCLHPFCRVCIYTLVQSATTFEIICPGERDEETTGAGVGDGDGNQQCKLGGLISLDEIEGILGSNSPDLESYLRRASLSADKAHGKDDDVQIITTTTKRKTEVPVAGPPEVKLFKPSARVPSTLKPTDLPQPKTETTTSIVVAAAGGGVSDVNLLRTQVPTNCSFCAEEMSSGEGIILQNCWHVFCRDCLRQTVKNCKEIKAKCPFPGNSATTGLCDGILLDKEVKLLLSEADYTAYMSKSLNEAEKTMNVYRCKSAGCLGFCELDVNNNKSVFVCSVCNKMNCLKCQVVHDGIDCKRYQELAAQISIYKRRNAKSIEKIVKGELTTGFDQLSQLMQTSPNNKQDEVSNNTVLGKLEDMDLLPSTKKFECPICMVDIRVGKGVILRDCLHTFCRTCLVSTITHSEDPDVKCPYQDGNHSCTSHLAPREIKALLKPDAHAAFTERSIRRAELCIPNSFHCQTPNCTGWCEPDEASRFFLCPVCDKVNCLSCKALHESYTCEQHKENVIKDAANKEVQRKNEIKGEQAIEKSLKNKTYVKCPRCKIVCQKISGCDHVTCAACKLPFNWTGK